MLDITVPSVRGCQSSADSAARIERKRPKQSDDILTYLHLTGPRTAYQIARATEFPDTTVSACVRGLELKGILVKLRRRDMEGGPLGGPAILWAIAVECTEPTREVKLYDAHTPVEFEEAGRVSCPEEADVLQALTENASGMTDAELHAWLMEHRTWNDEQRRHVSLHRGSLIRKGLAAAKRDYTRQVYGEVVKRINESGVRVIVWEALSSPPKDIASRERRVRGHSAATKEAQPYSSAQSYAVGDKIVHAEHGIGYVEFVDMDGSQIEVTFPSGARELATKRAAA